jgi:hypothetical protein
MNDFQRSRPPANGHHNQCAFLRVYCEWLAKASEQDLEELVTFLNGTRVGDACPAMTAMRTAMYREAIHRNLPHSFIQRLQLQELSCACAATA